MYAKTADEAQAELSAHQQLLEKLISDGRGASLAVKPSTLGATFDRELCRRNLLAIAGAAGRGCIPVELDMEGQGLVDFTLRTAIEAASTGLPVTLALQAYLDRTPADLERAIDGRLRVRLVKGAYLGDTADFREIQKRMRNLAGRLLEAGADFYVGTHDPELVGWLEHAAGPFTARVRIPDGAGRRDQAPAGIRRPAGPGICALRPARRGLHHAPPALSRRT